MKKILLFFVLVLAFGAVQAHAKIPVIYGTHEKINEVAKLPSDYDDEDGTSFSLGYKYTMAHLFWIPLWQTDQGKVVALETGTDEPWYDIDEILADSDARAELFADAGVGSMSDLKKMPFWDAWGGKLLVAGIVIFFVILGIARKKDEPEAKTQASAMPE